VTGAEWRGRSAPEETSLATSTSGAGGGAGLLERVRAFLDDAARVYAGRGASAEYLEEQRKRLDEPLRVAIAGRVKAGKSTLLNALVGEPLAPTDEGECTQIVTWYHDGVTYRVTLYPRDGEPCSLKFHRVDDGLDVDLDGVAPDAVERLDVEWPSSALRTITLIDTPGIAALSGAPSARTADFLTPSDHRETAADAVLYLMKHLHATDVDFLSTFHDEEVSQATPVNAIAVLSRADEIGGGRLDSLESAARIAARYAHDEKVRRLAQTVLPVAGLLAQTGETLREAEYQAIATLAKAPAADVDRLLVSADRFANADAHVGLTTLEREALLERLGLFGVRLAIALVRDGTAPNSDALAKALVARSGLPALRGVLLAQFAERRDLLKARSGILAVETLALSEPVPGSEELLSTAEQLTAGAHELAELRLLTLLRSGAVDAKPDDVALMERLAGGDGAAVNARLGLPADADAAAIRAAASEQLARWQKRAESPMASRATADAARLLVRTCEAILAFTR
jgi:hypothetical protein